MSSCLGILSYNSENIANFERTDAFSVELWFYQMANKTAALASHMTPDSMKRGWMCNVWNFRNVGFILCSQDVAPNKLLHVRTASNQYTINTWVHIVFTYNGNSQLSGCKCYINGANKVLSLTGSNTLDATIKSEAAKLFVGHNTAYTFFPGRVDEFVIYDRVLASTEVTQRYNSGNGRESLIGSAYLQYHLNEISGNTVIDSLVTKRNAQTVDNPSWVAGRLNNCVSLNGSSQYITT